MTKNQKWIVKHFEELVDQYGGKYIAVANEKVVAVGESPAEVKRKAKSLYPEEKVSVMHVPQKEWLGLKIDDIQFN